MAPATADAAVGAGAAVGRVKTALGVAACERDAEKLELIEQLTKGFDAEQQRVLAAILARNNGAEYLRRHGMEGCTDRESFKARVPVVTYEDLRPEIERIANGDRSNIISSHPISEFLTRPVACTSPSLPFACSSQPDSTEYSSFNFCLLGE